MKSASQRIVLFSLALGALALAAALGLCFTYILSHIDPWALGGTKPGSSMTNTPVGRTEAALVKGLLMFETLAQWIVTLAGLIALIVLPMAALVLLGLGGVCLHSSLAGLRRPSTEPVPQNETVGSADRYAGAEPIFDALPLLRKLKPVVLS